MGDQGESKSTEPTPSSSPWSGSVKNTGAAKQRPQHEKLKEYEARRRLAYTSKFDTMSLHWKSYRDLLSASLSETSRAQRLVLGTCKAHQIYADAMEAMYKDVYIDEKGNIANDKQQKRLSASRKTEFRERKVKDDKKQQTPVLKEIRDTQQHVAAKFGENAKNMDEEIAGEIGALLNDLKQRFAEMEQLGSCILAVLEKTEQEVVQCWGAYLRGQSNANTSGMSPVSPQETAPKNGESVDPWFVEMQYRVTVAYQNAAWEKGSGELTSLFGKIKQEEIQRRMNLREFLVAFVQRQERMFMSLPGIHNSVLDDLMSKDMTKEEIEHDVRAAIAVRTEKFRKPTMQTTGQSDIPAEDLEIGSPMSSDLLVMAKVVLRKGTAAAASVQKTSLAIITSDYYLHMVDVDPDKVSLGDSEETVFQMLIPKVIIPTAQNYMMGVSNFSKGLSETLPLAESMILGNCTAVQKDDTSFELTEVVDSKGASKMFLKSAKKKVLITTASKEETNEWMATLTS